MRLGARDPLCDVIDSALDQTALNDANDFLFRFSHRVLFRLHPDYAEKAVGFSENDMEKVRNKFKGMKPLEVFPAMESGHVSRRNLLSNLYQAIQENSDLDGVAEIIYGLWETLEREGYAPVLISEIYKDALRDT